MKRGWLLIIVLITVMITAVFVSAKTYDFSGCWGVNMCGDEYTCGYNDSICPDDFFTEGSDPKEQLGCAMNFPDIGYAKCIDPDCGMCVNGTVRRALPNDPLPIENATVIYEQDVWTNGEIETIRLTTQTDINGRFYMDVPAGNDVFFMAESPIYTPDPKPPITNFDQRLVGGCMELNFSLRNGSCEGDCTRQGSNYCDGSCHLLGPTPDDLCIFNTTINYTIKSESVPRNITIKSPFSQCTRIGTVKGSVVELGNFTNLDDQKRMCVRVSCCEGDPFETVCPEISINPQKATTKGNIKDAIKVTRIASDKGQPIKLNLYYWE